MNTRRLIVIECLLKNALIIVILFFTARSFSKDILLVPKDQQGNILKVMGLLLAGSIAGRYSFSYEKTNVNSHIDRIFGHLTTFLLNLSIGYMFSIVLTVLNVTPGVFNDPIALCAIMVYMSIIVYDLWDVLRVAHYDIKYD